MTAKINYHVRMCSIQRLVSIACLDPILEDQYTLHLETMILTLKMWKAHIACQDHSVNSIAGTMITLRLCGKILAGSTIPPQVKQGSTMELIRSKIATGFALSLLIPTFTTRPMSITSSTRQIPIIL